MAEHGPIGPISRLLLHVVASINLGYALYYEFRSAQLPQLVLELRLEAPMGGKLKYLTVLVGLLQFGYYLLALVHDVRPKRQLLVLRDFVFASLGLPLALTISVTFWMLYFINGEFIYPYFLDQVYPRWHKQTMHTHVVVYMLLELYLAPHQYPRRYRGLLVLGLAMFSYLMWLLMVRLLTGQWVYHFLDGLSPVTLYFFFALVTGSSFGYYLLGECLNHKLWHQ